MSTSTRAAVSTASTTSSCSSSCRILRLKEQIKSNAGLLFPNAVNVPAGAQAAYDVVILIVGGEKTTKFQAALTYASSRMDLLRKNAIAAKGLPGNSFEEALEGLLLVTVTALERYGGAREAGAPAGVGGRMVDEALILGKSSGGLFGRK